MLHVYAGIWFCGMNRKFRRKKKQGLSVLDANMAYFQITQSNLHIFQATLLFLEY